jgi:hypothetical protein
MRACGLPPETCSYSPTTLLIYPCRGAGAGALLHKASAPQPCATPLLGGDGMAHACVRSLLPHATAPFLLHRRMHSPACKHLLKLNAPVFAAVRGLQWDGVPARLRQKVRQWLLCAQQQLYGFAVTGLAISSLQDPSNLHCWWVDGFWHAVVWPQWTYHIDRTAQCRDSG